MPYTAVVLTQDSHQLLMARFEVPVDYQVKGHHMTIDLKPMHKSMACGLEGAVIPLTVTAIGHGEGIIAVAVQTAAPSKNEIKHITLGHRPDVKPKESNNITDWEAVEAFVLYGTVEECQ